MPMIIINKAKMDVTYSHSMTSKGTLKIHDLDEPGFMSVTNVVDDDWIATIKNRMNITDNCRVLLFHPDNTITEWVDGSFKFIKE